MSFRKERCDLRNLASDLTRSPYLKMLRTRSFGRQGSLRMTRGDALPNCYLKIPHLLNDLRAACSSAAMSNTLWSLVILKTS